MEIWLGILFLNLFCVTSNKEGVLATLNNYMQAVRVSMKLIYLLTYLLTRFNIVVESFFCSEITNMDLVISFNGMRGC